MFYPRFNAYYRDLSSLNSSSTTLGKVVMKPCPTRMEGSMMVAYMHYYKNFQTLDSISAQKILPFVAKNMMRRGQEVLWRGMNERMKRESCVQWLIPKARVTHNGICCLPHSPPNPLPSLPPRR